MCDWILYLKFFILNLCLLMSTLCHVSRDIRGVTLGHSLPLLASC